MKVRNRNSRGIGKMTTKMKILRKRRLLIVFTMALCMTSAMLFTGCGDSADAVATAGGTADTTSADANSGDAGNVTDANSASDNATASGQTDTSASQAAGADTSAETKTTKNGTTYNVESPWESFDMYGLPERLDLRKTDDGDVLVLVNKLHAVSKNYKPTNMVSINGKYTTNQGLEMKADAYKAFKKMRKAARADGKYFKICSAYRSYETQKYLYENYLSTMGKELRDIRSAAPGRSEHHTGYAIDITCKSMGWTLSQDFASTSEGKWIKKHCAEYGFIIRYPKDKTDITGYDYEPWHLRYVGVDVAKEITKKGITLEEYLKK